MNRDAWPTPDASVTQEAVGIVPVRTMRAYPVRLHAARGHAWFARPERSDTYAVGRPISSLPALRDAERTLSGQNRAIAKRPLRIPADAFVPVRSHLPRPTGPQLLLASPRAPGSANDNGGPASATGWMTVRLREGFFLALLAALLAATFYIGRQNALQNVIVIPEPWSSHSRLS